MVVLSQEVKGIAFHCGISMLSLCISIWFFFSFIRVFLISLLSRLEDISSLPSNGLADVNNELGSEN